jgi:YD repeat-containing protein
VRSVSLPLSMPVSRRVAVGVCAGVVAGSLAMPPAAAQTVSTAEPTAPTVASAAAAVDGGVNAPRVSQPREVPAADGELVGRRTVHSRTYREPDGSLRTVLGASPVNFTDSRGALAPIDTTLVPAGKQTAGSGAAAAGGGVGDTPRPPGLSVPGRGDGPVRVQSAADGWVQTRLLGAAAAAVAVNDSTATAAEALPGVSVGWTSTLGGVKETLTLASAQAASSFRFALTVAPGLTPVLTGDGTVQVQDSAGAAVWVLPAPFMDDATGAHSDAVRYSLKPAGDGAWELAMAADPAWLAEASRRFPVVIDPTVLLSAGGTGASEDLACEIRSSAASTNYCTAAGFAVGAASGSVSRAAVRFPQLNQVVPANAVIAAAELELPVTAADGSGSLTVQARPLTGPFTAAATWNTKDGSNTWTGGAGALGQSSTAVASTTLASSPVGTTVVLPVSDLARQWLTGQTPNYGLLLKSSDESVLRRATLAALSATCTSSSCGSRLQVSYVERLGKYNATQFFDTALTDTSKLNVNLATGNAVLSADDLGVKRTWNSKNTERVGQTGRGWNWGAGRDTTAYAQPFADRAIRFYAPGRSMYMFPKNADGSYTSPPGLTATATNNGGADISLFFGRSKTTMTFGGSHSQLQSSADRNGNTTRYTYTSTLAPRDDFPFTATITDPAGRVLTASNNGRFLTQISDAGSRTTGYGYGSTGDAADWLTSVTDAAGGVTGYDYDADGRIKRITTPAARSARLGW